MPKTAKTRTPKVKNEKAGKSSPDPILSESTVQTVVEQIVPKDAKKTTVKPKKSRKPRPPPLVTQAEVVAEPCVPQPASTIERQPSKKRRQDTPTPKRRVSAALATPAVSEVGAPPPTFIDPSSSSSSSSSTISTVDESEEEIDMTRTIDGLKACWYVETVAGDKLTFNSLRALVSSLKLNYGLDLGKVEGVRAFIHRRNQHSRCKTESFARFNGLSSLRRIGSESNYLDEAHFVKEEAVADKEDGEPMIVDNSSGGSCNIA
jgi:hypothetical protein